MITEKEVAMKNFLFILLLFSFLVACDDETENTPKPEIEATVVDSIQNYIGNFITVGNAAVLKGDQFIFQVKMDSTATGLKAGIENYVLQNPNVIPVEVTGKVVENPGVDGYSQLIELREVVKIFAERKEEIVKTEN